LAQFLTNVLNIIDFNDFILQVNHIAERQAKEMQEDELGHNVIQTLMGDGE
jgi:hypothetical protein